MQEIGQVRTTHLPKLARRRRKRPLVLVEMGVFVKVQFLMQYFLDDHGYKNHRYRFIIFSYLQRRKYL